VGYWKVGVEDIGCRVWGSGFRIQGSGVGVESLGSGVGD
jgi:hypothetical protein